MKQQDYPSLYQRADEASKKAQKKYMRFQIANLSLLVLGSLVAAFTTIIPTAYSSQFYFTLAALLLGGGISTWILQIRSYDTVWFDCRAIAESTKTVAWKFMMKAAPFEMNQDATTSFVHEIQAIRQARPSTSAHFPTESQEDGQLIKERMKEIRNLSILDRKEIYLEERLRDQKQWYSQKSTINSKQQSKWFWTTIILQGGGFLLAFYEAIHAGFKINIVPILMTCATAAIAWSQMKRHSELAQTYALSEQELIELETIYENLTDEQEILARVKDVEDTISREHTMWCARRHVIHQIPRTS